MIKFYCPNCNQKLGVPDEYANRRVRCNKCNQPCRVPQPQPASQVVPAGLEVLQEQPRQHQAPPPQSVEPIRRHPAPVESEQASGFAADLDIGLVEVNPNLEALAAVKAARDKQRNAQLRSSFKSARSSEGSSRFSGVAIGAGKIPLSIGAAFAFGIGVCILWTIVARITGFIFAYAAVGVAAAAAYGLVVMTEKRNAGLGIAAILISLLCIVIGKFMIAKWVIMPLFKSEMVKSMEAEPEVLFHTLSAEEKAGLAADPMLTYNMGVMELWERGQFDENTSKELIMASVMKDTSDEEAAAPEGFDTEHQAVLTHTSQWSEAQMMEALEKHYDRYLKHFQGWFANSNIVHGFGFVFAFIGAFSLWDLIVLPISGITAYKIASGGS